MSKDAAIIQVARKTWGLIESPAGLVTCIFGVAVFLYSTFATSSDLEKVDARITRSNDFQNKQLKDAVDRLDARQEKTNDILTKILMEARKR